jgi:hypothetical protein
MAYAFGDLVEALGMARRALREESSSALVSEVRQGGKGRAEVVSTLALIGVYLPTLSSAREVA